MAITYNWTVPTTEATVLGWVELNDPGFVEEKEQAVAQKLQAKLDEPVRSSVSVL